ncbi:hypothetical protein [Terrisporobacter glycolicus]|uniref:hypothetical protein n=1 Tax=Terrisporobacter glycolicus TaxID=36841 RepID=UPI003463A776
MDGVCTFEFAECMNNTIEKSKLVSINDGGHGAFYECKDNINAELEKVYNKQLDKIKKSSDLKL